MIGTPTYRQVSILDTAQALFQIVSVMVMTVGGLACAQLASSPTWATLPITTMFLGTASVTFPAAMWMARVGGAQAFFSAALGLAGGTAGHDGETMELGAGLAHYRSVRVGPAAANSQSGVLEGRPR